MITQISKIEFDGQSYFIDFRLGELRPTGRPYISIPFKNLTDEQKAILRGVRFRETNYGYIKGLDD